MSRPRRILAVDVGGTKIHLAIFCRDAEGLRIEFERRLPSAPERSLEELIDGVLPLKLRRGLPAVFAVAGPVRGREARLTNLPWELSSEALSGALDLREVRLINDVEAMAWSLEAGAGLLELKAGKAVPGGHRALLSLGTGLGEGGAVQTDGRYHPWAGEGGHCDWAPGGELEWELALFLRARLGLEHLSRERLLSGEGLVNITRFIFSGRGRSLEDFLQKGQDAAVVQIHTAAREKSDPACREALELFVRLMGAEAGNLALVCGATGGVYLGGGMAVKLAWALNSGIFREAFLGKGRMNSLLEAIPIMLLQGEGAPLQGAAIYALSRVDPGKG